MALATEQLFKKKGKGDVRVRKGTSGICSLQLLGSRAPTFYLIIFLIYTPQK